MSTITKIRVNMHDTFSKCIHSITKEVDDEVLKKLEYAMVTGQVAHRFENNINWHWVIDEIEILK